MRLPYVGNTFHVISTSGSVQQNVTQLCLEACTHASSSCAVASTKQKRAEPSGQKAPRASILCVYLCVRAHARWRAGSSRKGVVRMWNRWCARAHMCLYLWVGVFVRVCVCAARVRVCARVRTCVRAYVRTCVRACVCACVRYDARACMRVCACAVHIRVEEISSYEEEHQAKHAKGKDRREGRDRRVAQPNAQGEGGLGPEQLVRHRLVRHLALL
mgnify:CR=1 FL=1